MVRILLTETGLGTAQKRYRLMSESFTAAPRQVAKGAANILRTALRHHAPAGPTHRLERQLNFVLAGTVARFYGPYYTKWVIEGRGEVWAGIFTGRSNKKFLHFFIDGKEIFTRHVRAAAPNDFRIPAMAEARPKIEILMHEAGVRTIRGEIQGLNLWSAT